MSGLCIGVAFSVIAASVPTESFTLAWTHSVEKTRWEEDYRIEKNRIVLVQARIRGSGAGMEPPAGAVLRNGVYEYRPRNVALEKFSIMRSAYAKDYELCWNGRCTAMTELLGPPMDEATELFPCPTR
jgi:hypothetical protein